MQTGESTMQEFLILQKDVDMSVLREGMSIPAIFQDLFYQKIGFRLKKGESCKIRLKVENSEYDAILKNYDFDQSRYPGHPDVLQIRYSPTSPLANKLRNIFSQTNAIVQQHLSERVDKRKQLRIPDEKKEHLAIYGTDNMGVLFVDCIVHSEYQREIQVIKSIDERSFETAIDENATIIEQIGIKKIRKISRAIGDNLKQLYGYRCQICGEYIGEKYGSRLIHAHHIDFFTSSLNNDASNIMIVCPNHHGIIHDKKPEYRRSEKMFIYPNGLHEGLKINLHL